MLEQHVGLHQSLRSAEPNVETSLRKDCTKLRRHGDTEPGRRMGAGMDGTQPIDAYPGIPLGRLQTRMTEQLGHVADVRTTFQHECGDGVPKEVATPTFLNSGLGDVTPDRS